jgi:hypothetical protein
MCGIVALGSLSDDSIRVYTADRRSRMQYLCFLPLNSFAGRAGGRHRPPIFLPCGFLLVLHREIGGASLRSGSTL